MLQRSRMWALIIATSALTIALVLLFAPSLSRPVAANPTATLVKAKPRLGPDATIKIVPADVLGAGAVRWMPATGEN